MTAQDSIQAISITGVTDTVVKYTRPQTPYQVLRLLPKDATPAQQDSAIQAWFQPGEIHYSEQPDTLHLPGESIPRDLKEVNLPQYYRENYFSNDTLYHGEIEAGRYGVAGDPVPYAIQNDDIITGLLIVCFLFLSFVFSRISEFLVHQTKNFFYSSKGDHTLTETGNEVKVQLVFMTATCLLLGILFYYFTINNATDTFSLESEHVLLFIYAGVFMVYILGKAILYSVVNNVFFDKKKNEQFLKSSLFITSLETILLYPLVLLLAYFHFSTLNAVIYFIFILFFTKILTFYKTYIIFFKQKRFFLQIILYFCALEIIPLSVLWTGLLVITNSLKVNF